jgi:methionine-rich copper-binding protein CopC
LQNKKSPIPAGASYHDMRKRILATLVVVLVSAPLAFAHAILLSAVPAANQSVSGPDLDVQLKFNCRIDSARSRLTLSSPDRGVRPLALQQSDPAVLHSHITGLATGEYRLQWQVLAADGHITRGEVPFSVR